MGDHVIKPTCITSEEHKEVGDPVAHYTGCLEFCKRKEYYTKLTNDGKGKQERIDSELRRTLFIRGALRTDDDEKHLVNNVESSFEAWRKSDAYTANIEKVREWRASFRPPRVSKIPEKDVEPSHDSPKEYDADIDINGYVIRFDGSKGVDDLGDKRFHGVFPDHKIRIEDLLKKSDDNPLTVTGQAARDAQQPVNASAAAQKTDETRVLTYFHLPANNMLWVEKAMSRYQNEEDLKHDGIHTRPKLEDPQKAYMILRPQFWKGQQYGGRNSLVHARHMRPICEIISSDPQTIKLDPMPKNMVLFLPYLHWDTDRYRERMSQFMDMQHELHLWKKQVKTDEVRAEKQRERAGLIRPCGKTGTDMAALWSNERHHAPVRKPTFTFAGALPPALAPFPKFGKYLKDSLFKRDRKGRVEVDNKLGQLLIDAALLFEAMACYRDKNLIEKYLHMESSPLHPRRTLDQAYYGTLKSTKWRDRDQVVYRGTRANPAHWSLHAVDRETRTFTCPRKDIDLLSVDEKKEAENESEEKKEARKINYRCPDCRDHIRKVPRLIMDPSGVHYRVRRALGNVREDHIRTVFDLALIVLNEATNTFFDRTKTPDRQPQVIDIFADTIGEVTNKQAIAFDHLWVWTSKLSNLSYPNPFSDLTEFVFPLLNINPEGKLQREIKDILDELDIMLSITRQQLEVIRRFKKNAEKMSDPAGQWRDKSPAFAVSPEDKGKTPTDAAKENTKKREEYVWFRTQAGELVSDIECHIGELEGLKTSAASTLSSLDHLLALMQQQASALQAWQAAKQADETVKQGRIILIFTLVTIIFLPLSFMSGIYGMNNTDFSVDGNNTMTLTQQVRLMVGISLGLIVAIGTVAVSTVRPPRLYYIWNYCVCWIFCKTGLYDLNVGQAWQRAQVIRATNRHIQEMKAEVMKLRQGRIRRKLEESRVKDTDNGQEGNRDGEQPGSNPVSRITSRAVSSVLDLGTGLRPPVNGHRSSQPSLRDGSDRTLLSV
ncbi:hypothetical protein QBC46DRAFT_441401 [Diplogelasinospora grovesii]|uniref:Uncharacterized protein n=1 Tax=Diplogelasinospora grovesii TaxID=303347 RepID=A0AAN6N3M6_9PEZI|nr:hypothetical protein QBC46DRAFT_441401 [Diplogelasinospora grovesii]